MKSKIRFQDQLSLNAGQKYCRMLQGEHSAKLSTSIKLPYVIKIFALSFLSGPLRQVLLYFLIILTFFDRNTIILPSVTTHGPTFHMSWYF